MHVCDLTDWWKHCDPEGEHTLPPNTLCVFVWVFYRLGSIRNISRELKQITSKDKKHLGKKQYIKSLTSLY